MMNHNPANLDAPQSLRQLLKQREDLSAVDRLRIVRHLALQVQALHQSGRTHRAIDAETVLIDDRLRAELASPPLQRRFGAPDADPEFCPPDLAGTEALRLPEKIEAAAAVLKKNRRTLTPQQIDFYQLGVLLCRLLSGESIARYMYSSKVKARVPQFTRSVLERALGYNAADRFDNCGQLIEALDEAIDRAGSQPVSAPMTETPLAGQVRATGDDTRSYSDASGSRVPDDTPLPFERLGHFRLLRRIGRGGMGDVYQAHDETLDRQVAIKVLPAELARDEDFVHRFQAEATAAAGLTHPNVVPVYFIGQDAGHHFFAMQYVEGQSLAERISRGQPLPLDQVQSILEQCLAGLDAAHGQGLIHRDIKPSNILLDHQNDRAVLVDFGLVRRLGPGEGITTAGMVLGTVDYIAPEQATGRAIDGRADLYALGVLAYQLLSGRLPFLAETPMAMIFQHTYEEPAPLGEIAPDVPQPIQNIVARMMAKHPDNRYASCAEALSDLTAFREGRPISAPTPNFQSDLRRTVDHLSAAMADHQRHRDQLTRLLSTTRTMAADLSAKITEQEQSTLAVKPSTTPKEAEAMHAQQKEHEETTAKLKSQQEEQLRQIEDAEQELSEVDATLRRLQGQWEGLKLRVQTAGSKQKRQRRPLAKRRRQIVVGVIVVGSILVMSVLFALKQPAMPILADSVAEFSGTQGKDNWYYGYIEPATSPDFIEMTHWQDDWGVEVGIWMADRQLYWTSLYAAGGHGNGLDTLGDRTQVEHWAVRRWISEVEGAITITGTIGKTLVGGNGVLGRILVDDTPIWSKYIEGTDRVGVDYNVAAKVHKGSTVDFVIDPFESDAVSDDTQFTATIRGKPSSQ